MKLILITLFILAAIATFPRPIESTLLDVGDAVVAGFAGMWLR